ncbi:MAG: dTDP-glucose 4,6-dehydratase [Flavobacteriales bacterium]|nr:dTDP-glucose 4,6-dehydratase [Flavobacteriales bacterium]
MDSEIKIQPKTVSILGCGWLGTPVAFQLAESGCEVKGSSTSDEKINRLSKTGIETYFLDLNHDNIPVLQDFLESEILIFTVPTSKVNLEALKNFLFKVNFSDVKKVILISTTAVYNNHPHPITEDDKDLINQDHPAFQIEQAFSELGIDLIILRMAGLIGAGRDPRNFSKSPKVLNTSNGRVNFIHLNDCIRIIQNLLEKDHWNEVYNCCMNEHPTKKEFYTQISTNPNLRFSETTDTTFKIIDNQKIKNHLNFDFIELYQSIHLP